MTENVGKLVGVVVVAVLVVVGVVATSGGDDVDFTRNAAFTKLPAAQRARLAPAFVEQAAPKANIWTTGGTTSYVPDRRNDGKVSIEAQKDAALNFKDGKSGSDIKALWTGKASVLEGRGVDDKGGTSSFRAGGGMNGKTGKAGIWSTTGANGLSGRKAGIWLQSGGVDGVADRIEKCGYVSDDEVDEIATANSLKNVLVSSYQASAGDNLFVPFDDESAGQVKGSVCLPAGTSASGGQEGEGMLHDTAQAIRVGKDEAKLLAACMESKVGDVFLKSHIKASAADCIATVLPALSPDRAKQLGTYWQTQQQLICVPPDCDL